ncbi:hypothetical protein BCR32DRAFT_275765 [Anaeromyces robustus]|uniref:Uncharacterized protein n=1 Tax=Anaeromyces robustus TaxID=1754192 RepID=A0A1Y1XK40_9FUNG|nr:hypothetical protein BCR32DRAFT_275765 [Anaeromyces robustus]|eukprot:ORX86085.1 hypothetical protein BCR32DRAFT_275765 [Anaeromyces robustus]
MIGIRRCVETIAHKEGINLPNNFINFSKDTFTPIDNLFYNSAEWNIEADVIFAIHTTIKILVSDHLPVDLLLGNKFIEKYKIHYNYRNKYVYSTLGLNHFKNELIKTFSNNNNNKSSHFNYNFLIYFFLSQKDVSGSNKDPESIKDIIEISGLELTTRRNSMNIKFVINIVLLIIGSSEVKDNPGNKITWFGRLFWKKIA